MKESRPVPVMQIASENTTESVSLVSIAETLTDSTTMAKLIIRRYQSTAQYFTEELGSGVGLDMNLILGGSFWMGTKDEEIERLVKEYDQEWFRWEGPQHKVNVPSFFMGRYPITQAQWRIVAGWEEQAERTLESDPSDFKEDYEEIERWQRPVENISWSNAVEFCNRLSKKTNKEYRLPTEAEWEYACRAGTKTPFHFGETITTDLANYGGNYTYANAPKGEYRQQTTPVGSFPPNAFGLYDMHGNVWEWCEDDWHDSYKNAPNDGSAWVSEVSSNKVIRDGSWDFDPGSCRSASRLSPSRDLRLSNIGFRVVCVVPRTT